MDEDGAAKAPVTRLRRRLSVEQSEESKSPLPTTPTKKRGARIAIPQLELIEENGPEKTPNKRTTRKSIVKDIVEEEKPLTPSRRSARIRSNTSIISDTPQNSPRAKRAMRRNSLVGSDNETQATTPARARRTRKDSATNIEKPADSTLINNVISEEPELEPSKLSKTPDNRNDKTISPNSLRKSTRLQAKQEKRQSGNLDDESLNKTPQNEATEEPKEITKAIILNKTQTPIKNTDKADLSLSSRNLIEESCKQPLKTTNAHNKSLSSLKEAQNNKRTRTKSWTTMAISPMNDNYFLSDNESTKKKVKSKFNFNNSDRKSGSGDSILINTSIKETMDNSKILLNSSTKRKKNQDQTLDCFVELGNDSNNDSKSKQGQAKNEKTLKYSDTQKLFETSPEAVIRSKVYIEDSDSNADAIEKQVTEDQCVPVVPHVLENQSKSPKLNQVEPTTFVSQHIPSTNNESCEPMDIDETMPENVVLNDSDDKSRNESLKINNQKRNSIESKKSSISKSISEDTNPNSENIHAIDIENENNKSKNSSIRKSLNAEGSNTTGNNTFNKTTSETNNTKRKSVLSKSGTEVSNKTVDNDLSKSQNKSNRKSSSFNSFVEDASKSGNQNKSTIVLSQIKENDELNPTTSKNDISLNVTDVEKHQKVLQNVYSTSTPLEDKIATKIMKQRVPINVSDIITKHDKESDTSHVNKDHSSDEESSDDDSDGEYKKASKLFINEADEASDNYESGDSQDEEERQYEKENEIIDKGETLTSDDDATNDTDYEKDSFVVSSDEEDNELLDGSADDLTMSDNELKMTAKSKKKYNERKSKEQKEASREMFEARHNTNNSKKRLNETNVSKSDQRFDSKLLESDDDSIKSKPKKTNRQRFNSSQDSSMVSSENESIQNVKKKSKRLSESIVNTEADESITIKKKQVKRLSESIDEYIDEKEITIFDTEVTEKDPLKNIKEEPKTPRQSLIYENVEVDENVSIVKVNQSRDPLESTIAQEEDDGDDSDISSNPEITSNYLNLLNNLNYMSNKENKKDISLNIDRKRKGKKIEPIVDEFKLTVTKKKKIKLSESQRQTNNEVQNDKEDSSDSIDMKLLFNEDSNDSEDQPKANSTSMVEDDFIPLKRTEAKTNIHEDGAESSFNITANESLNKSLKKKKKGDKSFNKDSNEPIDKSPNISLKKNKDDVIVDEDIKNKSIHNVSANVSLNTSSKKRKKNSISAVDELNVANEPVKNMNTSANKLLNTSKKNKKNSISITNKESDTELTAEEPVLIIHDTIGNRKQKRNSSSKDDISELEVSLNTSLKKHKRNSVSEHLNESANTKSSYKKKDDDEESDMPEEIPFTSTKNKSNRSTEIEADVSEVLNTSGNKKGKKEKKQASNVFATTLEGFQAAAALYDSDESPKNNRPQKQSEDLSADHKDTADIKNKKSESEKKKRKRKKKQLSKDNPNNEQSVTDDQNNEESRKRKLSTMSSVESTKGEDKNLLNVTNNSTVTQKRKKQKLTDNSEIVSTDANIQSSSKKNRKRKKRDEDLEPKASKVMKEKSYKNKEVVRLPVDIINKLDDKPNKHKLEKKKTMVSTSEFLVETAKVRKNKPSHYLEESIYLNEDSPEGLKKIRKIKKPKVLPFVPTAATSAFGFTTNFQVSVIPKATKFEAKTTEANFKNDYLQKKLKKFGTYELLKTQRKLKLSKF